VIEARPESERTEEVTRPAARRRAVSRRAGRGRSARARRAAAGWLLCLPALSIFSVFLVGPALVAIGLSLFEWDGFSPDAKFVGLQNYADLFSSREFWRSATVNIVVAGATLALQMPLALLLATLLASRRRASALYRGALFTPQVLSIAAVGLIWTLVYDPYQGMLNRVLGAVGLSGLERPWLGETSTALPAVIITSTWFYFGFHMILFLAGMAAIPRDLYEAARLETDSSIHLFRYVTLPLLREVMLISFVLIISGAFGHLIGLFAVMTNGGPEQSTQLLGLLTTDTAFRGLQYGYAGAISVVMLFTVMLVIAWPTWRVARERIEF
jgi:raffinose/stachyose/melibiose transport system permease protein